MKGCDQFRGLTITLYYTSFQNSTSARVLRAATMGRVRILSTSTAAHVYVDTLANTARLVGTNWQGVGGFVVAVTLFIYNKLDCEKSDSWVMKVYHFTEYK